MEINIKSQEIDLAAQTLKDIEEQASEIIVKLEDLVEEVSVLMNNAQKARFEKVMSGVKIHENKEGHRPNTKD